MGRLEPFRSLFEHGGVGLQDSFSDEREFLFAVDGVVCGLVWTGRKQKGERLTFDDDFDGLFDSVELILAISAVGLVVHVVDEELGQLVAGLL